MCLTHFIAALPEPLGSTYEIVEGLGAGSYAVVYQVRDRETQEDFAMKVIEKEPMRARAMLPQLKAEVAIAAEHAGFAHIAQLLEVTETSTHFFLRFELCRANLDDVCKQQGPMTEEEAFQWLRQACVGVKELHASGIIHRDLKPSNFLVDAKGNLCICDFGFACRAAERPAGIVGTPQYSAPEMNMPGKAHTQKVDIYCLGACLQHLLLGRMPDGAGDMPKTLSGATRELLEEMMSPDPQDRPTIDELLETPQLSQSLLMQLVSQWHVVFQGFSGQ
jgi:serine/threonine protein kinase